MNTKLDISALAHEKTRTLFRCDDVPEELVAGTKPDLEKIEQRIKDKRLKISVTTIRRRLGIDMFDFSDWLDHLLFLSFITPEGYKKDQDQ